jgi:hypothetical protein
VNGCSKPPRWLLCQASTVLKPGTTEQLTILVQLDITDAKQVHSGSSSSSTTAVQQRQLQLGARGGVRHLRSIYR